MSDPYALCTNCGQSNFTKRYHVFTDEDYGQRAHSYETLCMACTAAYEEEGTTLEEAPLS